MKRDRTHLYIALAILAAALVIVCCSLAWGETIHLAWDHDGNVDGYRLYMAEQGSPLVTVWQGTEKTSGPISLQDGITYRFAVTAYSETHESTQSDILQYTAAPEQQVIIIPGRPKALRIEFE